MLDLHDRILVGSSEISVRGAINIYREHISSLVKNGEIELNSHALSFLESSGLRGVIDYGPRDADFFPAEYIMIDK